MNTGVACGRIMNRIFVVVVVVAVVVVVVKSLSDSILCDIK